MSDVRLRPLRSGVVVALLIRLALRLEKSVKRSELE